MFQTFYGCVILKLPTCVLVYLSTLADYYDYALASSDHTIVIGVSNCDSFLVCQQLVSLSYEPFHVTDISATKGILHTFIVYLFCKCLNSKKSSLRFAIQE